MSLLVLFLGLQSVRAYLKVLPDELFGGFEFKTARYSEYVGDFDDSCLVYGTASILTPEEDLCDTSTITTAINGTVLFNIATVIGNCNPEIAYQNAEELGALVLVDVFPAAPGIFRYSLSLAEEPYQGSIPFIQTGTEFLGGILLNPQISPMFGNLVIEVNGCADESIWEDCFDKSATEIYVPTGMISLLFSFYALKASFGLEDNPASRPRIFLLRFISATLFYTAGVFIPCLFTQYQHPWLTEDLIPNEIKNGLGMLMLGLHLQVILLTALYWGSLREGVFRPDAQTNEFWNDKFFHHYAFYASYLIGVSYAVVGYLALSELFKHPKFFKSYIYALFAIQTALSAYFVVTIVRFVSRITKYLDKLGESSVVSYQTALLKKKEKCIKVLCGDFNTKSNLVEAKPMRYLVKFSRFLSRCLVVYLCLIVVSHVFAPFVFFDNLPYETLQDEAQACMFSNTFGFYNLLRTLSTCVLVIGLGWRHR